ncbi:hypothetical protein M3Y99_00581000 [Aphelenchoides fujianensis]|nr:hypothetical protein M3Y99_00581000 [Aphelenchoides fujianensis]
MGGRSTGLPLPFVCLLLVLLTDRRLASAAPHCFDEKDGPVLFTAKKSCSKASEQLVFDDPQLEFTIDHRKDGNRAAGSLVIGGCSMPISTDHDEHGMSLRVGGKTIDTRPRFPVKAAINATHAHFPPAPPFDCSTDFEVTNGEKRVASVVFNLTDTSRELRFRFNARLHRPSKAAATSTSTAGGGEEGGGLEGWPLYAIVGCSVLLLLLLFASSSGAAFFVYRWKKRQGERELTTCRESEPTTFEPTNPQPLREAVKDEPPALPPTHHSKEKEATVKKPKPGRSFERLVAEAERKEKAGKRSGIPDDFRWEWPRDRMGEEHVEQLLRVITHDRRDVREFLRRFPLHDPAAYGAFRKRLEKLHDWCTEHKPEPDFYLVRHYMLMHALDSAWQEVRKETPTTSPFSVGSKE